MKFEEAADGEREIESNGDKLEAQDENQVLFLGSTN